MNDSSDLDGLAYLYVAFGHSSDHDMSAEEMRALAGHLRAWTPDQDDARLSEALQSAVVAYQQLPTLRDRLARALEQAKALAGSLPPEQLPKILADLQSIADADGVVTREERSLMDAISKVMKLT